MNKLNSDFELCNSMFKNITCKYRNNTLATDFTDYERVIVLVWTVTGIIENGGFQYLFESDLPGDNDLLLSIKAFENIECNDAKVVIEDVLERIRSVNSTISTKLERYLTIPKEDRDRFDARFWSEMDKINENLANFIRRNQQ